MRRTRRDRRAADFIPLPVFLAGPFPNYAGNKGDRIAGQVEGRASLSSPLCNQLQSGISTCGSFAMQTLEVVWQEAAQPEGSVSQRGPGPWLTRLKTSSTLGCACTAVMSWEVR